MKTLYKSLLAFVAWIMLSVSALAVDVIVVSHGQANDPFWSVAKNGVDKGCADMGISCKYTAPATFDMVEMAKLIDNAVSQKPKGIVITLPDAAALGAGLAGEAALKALESAGKVGKVKLGTFDMSPGMLKAAAAGKVEFLIDQQQYLQGYLPIAIFGQYMRYGTMPAGVVMTGPGFVTPDNAAKVIKWAAQGYR